MYEVPNGYRGLPAYDGSAAIFDLSLCTTMVSGCTDSRGANYLAEATQGDPSAYCAIFGCTDSTARNFAAHATAPTPQECVLAHAGCTFSRAPHHTYAHMHRHTH